MPAILAFGIFPPFIAVQDVELKSSPYPCHLRHVVQPCCCKNHVQFRIRGLTFRDWSKVMWTRWCQGRRSRYSDYDCLLACCMEQSPSWEANRFSASQKIPRILRNPKVHCRIHKFPPPAPILSKLDPVHTPTSHCPKINLNIILPSTPGSPKQSVSLSFPRRNLYTPVFSPSALHTQPN
jgi:hypothetical protein